MRQQIRDSKYKVLEIPKFLSVVAQLLRHIPTEKFQVTMFSLNDVLKKFLLSLMKSCSSFYVLLLIKNVMYEMLLIKFKQFLHTKCLNLEFKSFLFIHF